MVLLQRTFSIFVLSILCVGIGLVLFRPVLAAEESQQWVSAEICPHIARPAVTVRGENGFGLYDPQSAEFCPLKVSPDAIQVAVTRQRIFYTQHDSEWNLHLMQQDANDSMLDHGMIESPLALIANDAGLTARSFLLADGTVQVVWNRWGTEIVGSLASDMEGVAVPIGFSADHNTLYIGHRIAPYGAWTELTGRYRALYTLSSDGTLSAVAQCDASCTFTDIDDRHYTRTTLDGQVAVLSHDGKATATWRLKTGYVGYPALHGKQVVFVSAELSDLDLHIADSWTLHTYTLNGTLVQTETIDNTTRTRTAHPFITFEGWQPTWSLADIEAAGNILHVSR